MFSPVTHVPTKPELTLFQKDLDKVTTWCTHNKLSVNVRKTKMMLLGRKHKGQCGLPIIKMNSCELEFVSTYRYLGLLLNVKLNFLEQVRQTLYTVAKKVNTLVHIRHYVNCDVALLIYKTNILPLFEYSNICMTLIPKQYAAKFQRIQNRVLRIIFYKETGMTLNQLHNRAKLAKARPISSC